MTGLHFTMSAEYATRQPREFWAEGRYRLAYEMLWAFGISIGQGEDLLRGKLKFIETDTENEFTLAKDNWRPNLSMCHRMRYPDPASREMSSIDAEAENALSFYRSYKEFVDDALSGGTRIIYGQEKTQLDEYLKIIHKQDEVASSSLLPGEISQYGIIDPSGDFYPCEYWMHDATCVALGYAGRAEAKNDGYILVSSHPIKGSWVDVGGEKKVAMLAFAQKETLRLWADAFDNSNWVKNYNLLRDGEIRL